MEISEAQRMFFKEPVYDLFISAQVLQKKTNKRGTLQKQGGDPKNLTDKTMKLVKQNKSYEKRRETWCFYREKKLEKQHFFFDFS